VERHPECHARIRARLGPKFIEFRARRVVDSGLLGPLSHRFAQ
jgi:hypothetical protein